MVELFLHILVAVVLLMLLFAVFVWKLSPLMQGMVKLFSKITASSDDNNIEKEQGGKYDTSMVVFLLLLCDVSIF